MMHDREKSQAGEGWENNLRQRATMSEADEQSGRDICRRRSGAGGGRAGTKRNVEKQSTHRTQGWARVTQALDRVRQAARLRKEEKFTALFHPLSVALFREAFFALKRDAAQGVDGLTWRTCEADLERKARD